MVSVPVGFGRVPKDESRVLNSRSRGARLLCLGASAAALLQSPPFASNFKGVWSVQVPRLSNTLHGSYLCHKTRHHFPRAINVTAGQSDGPWNLDIDGFIIALRKLWDLFPQPVRSFPWTKALISFYQLIFELTWAVAKYLCIPLLAVSSLSEMSYCAHERKMVLIPIPLLAGFAVAGVLKDTAIELSPDLKEGGFPGHLLLIAIFFLLLKLPGPHYPYWGRLIIPHFANGGLWRTLWSAFIWYRMPQQTSGTALGVSVADNPSEDKKQ